MIALAFLSTGLKLALAACLLSDGDAIGAAVVATLSPGAFLLCGDSRRARF